MTYPHCLFCLVPIRDRGLVKAFKVLLAHPPAVFVCVAVSCPSCGGVLGITLRTPEMGIPVSRLVEVHS